MDEARSRAKNAYEWGRAQMALTHALIAFPAMLIALISPASRVHIAACGGALFCVVAIFSFLGGTQGRSVMPGLLAGFLPLVVPAILRTLGHGCTGMECCLTGRCPTCLVACVGSGLVAGAVIGIATLSESRRPWTLLGSAALIAITAGSLGCLVAGVSGIVGMVAGTIASATPILVARRA
jgi:hypothetical protein